MVVVGARGRGHAAGDLRLHLCQFIALVEKLSGQQLDELFTTWLFTAGRPELTAAVASRSLADTDTDTDATPVRPKSWDKIQQVHADLATGRPPGVCEAHRVQRPVLRLTVFVVVLGVVGLITAFFVPISADGLHHSIDRFGPLAGPVYVVVSALLALIFVPGPLLSIASGALFGTFAGFVWGLLSSVLTGVLALLLARRAGQQAVEELSGERTQALITLARTHGTLAVVVQRLLPGVPDAPLSYAFGLIGVRAHQIALGTLIGSAPRAFAYTALGSAATSGNRALAVVAIGVGIAVSVLGVVVGALLTRRRRRENRAPDEEPTES